MAELAHRTGLNPRRIFYGWWMVAAACGLQFMQAGLLQQSFGAYVAVLRDEFGWSKTALSGGALIQQVESALLGPIQGWFVDRFGPRGMICFGVALFGIGFMLLSRVDSLAGFYTAFVVIALGSGLGGFFPLTIALVNWFERRRARALSAMSGGYALGGMAVPVVALLLQAYGWRTTALASGVIIIAVGLPLATLIRSRPEDHGEVVDGIRNPLPEAGTETRVIVGQMSGPMIAGILADAAGHYRTGFTIVALFAGVGSVFFLLARPPGARAARIRS